ncbi:MAG: cell division protein ZapA [Rhodocyclaceae bacterium]
MSSPSATVEVSLMGRSYRVACPPGSRAALDAAAGYLDGKLKEISARTRASGERLAVMAALNIAHELIELRAAPSPELEAFKGRIDALASRIDGALAQQDPLF